MKITRTNYKLADGLGVKQDLPRSQVLAVRKKYADKAPVTFVGNFPMWNYGHVDSVGRLKRSPLTPSARNLNQSQPVKNISFRPWISTGMNNSLYHQLQQPAPFNPNIQHPGEYIMPNYQQPNYRQYQQPNYAGQYQQPAQAQRIDMNNATITPQFNNTNQGMNSNVNYRTNMNQTPAQPRPTMAQQNQNQINNSELQMQEAQREIRDAQNRINAIHQQKRRAMIQRNNQMQR